MTIRILKLAAMLLAGLPMVPSAYAIPISFGTATIDGSLGAGEWDDAASWSVFSGAYAGSTLYMMNDLDNLYMALSVVDPTLAANDIMEVRFDNGNNGTSDLGDDELFLRPSVFTDSHFSGAAWGVPDIQQDGTGAVQDLGATNVFEMAHALNSGDGFDFSLSAGDTVGFCLRYFDDGLATNASIFPVSCVLADNEQRLYEQYVVAAQVSEPGSLALMALGLFGVGFARWRKRR